MLEEDLSRELYSLFYIEEMEMKKESSAREEGNGNIKLLKWPTVFSWTLVYLPVHTREELRESLNEWQGSKSYPIRRRVNATIRHLGNCSSTNS